VVFTGNAVIYLAKMGSSACNIFVFWGIRKEASNGHRLSGMEEDCIGAQSPQRSVALDDDDDDDNLCCNECLSDWCTLQYGGNPVSCATVSAVLDIMERQNLREHATRVGNHVLNSLRQLALKHPIVGDVRGVGLFIGIELVEDKDTKIPATAKAQLVVSR